MSATPPSTEPTVATDGPRPSASGPRTILVGTAVSARELHHVLSVLEPTPRVLGCLLPATTVAAAPRDMPCPVLGAIDDLDATLAEVRDQGEPVDQVLVTLPLTMIRQVRALGAHLERAGVRWRFMPTLGDQLAGRTTSRLTGALPRLNEDTGASDAIASEDDAPTEDAVPPLLAEGSIDPAHLLDRQPRPLDASAIGACLRHKRVMITGAGGSIGAELARRVSRFEPAALLLVERSENALFEIDRELERVHPDLARRAILHDVTHRAGTLELLEEYRPEVIFHAAAHKHVPMMEEHPAHAVENNFYGTRAIADAADACGAERFVMISTDKAVNPSSVMGATKRLAELYVQDLDARSPTTFAAVRFGNVLGSACSVLPIWTSQLAHGAPITVTHPEMTRYFMTIPEAAGLVLQAAAMARDTLPYEAQPAAITAPIGTRNAAAAPDAGRVFLLDMGEPVRIVELARRFVRAQGLEPDVDVPIVYTGVRPGEKLFETLAYDSEDLIPTAHASVRIWRTARPEAANMRRLIDTFDALRERSGDPSHPWRGVNHETIVTALRRAIPEMVTAAAG